MTHRFKNVEEHRKWLASDREHEECFNCAYQYTHPAMCGGHDGKPARCVWFKPKKET